MVTKAFMLTFKAFRKFSNSLNIGNPISKPHKSLSSEKLGCTSQYVRKDMTLLQFNRDFNMTRRNDHVLQYKITHSHAT